jgi:hypothetical protein
MLDLDVSARGPYGTIHQMDHGSPVAVEPLAVDRERRPPARSQAQNLGVEPRHRHDVRCNQIHVVKRDNVAGLPGLARPRRGARAAVLPTP